MFWIYGVTKLSSRKIIADCEGTVVNGALGLLCRIRLWNLWSHTHVMYKLQHRDAHHTALWLRLLPPPRIVMPPPL